MSAAADNEPVADSEEERIFGPPENYPVLSSSESWHESEEPSSQSDDEETAEDASEEDQIKSEDEGPQSESNLKKGKQRHGFTKSQLSFDKSAVQAYKTLLKDMHVDADSKTWNKQQNVSLSTVGLVQWTGKENDTFFTALARKGRGNVGEIAQQIKSKSRLEVADYIEFLEERLQHHRFSEPSLLEAEVSAAVEISEEVEEVLNHFAETVALEEQRKDLFDAEKEHGLSEYWILDRAKADEIEELLASDDEDALPEAISLSAGLLDLKNWVQLSQKIFMNPGKSRPEDSWKNVAQKGEMPSLTADALGEFYDLTVDLVIRLMEEAHNTALDRLDKERRHRQVPVVRKKDVQRALNTMGMKCDTFEYYVNLPRRLKLDVTRGKRKGKAKNYVSWDKVERMLSIKRRKKAKGSSGSSGDSSEEDTESDEKSDDDSQEENLDEYGSSEDESDIANQDDQSDPEEEGEEEEAEEVSSADEANEANEDNNVPAIKTEPTDDSQYEEISESDYQQLEIEQRLDDYNDYLDRQASHKEEARIRVLLDSPAIDSLVPYVKKGKEKQEEPPEITEDMRREIMQNNVVVDWRKNLVYQDEWETYGMKTRDVEKEIAANRNKRRRLE